MADTPSLALPRRWSRRLKSALLHATALARVAMLEIRGGLEDSPLERARLIARADALASENARLLEELRIKDHRMRQIPAHDRPRYEPHERLAILTLRAAAGWNAAQTARRFLVAPATIAAWMRRLDEQGPGALVATPQPVNRFPQFVTLLVHKLHALAPAFGRRKLADVLARAGLRLAPSTVRRLLRTEPRRTGHGVALAATEAGAADPGAAEADTPTAPRTVEASYPHHLWHIDITIVPTLLGFWVPWLPFALAPRWPNAWCIAVVIDHFSRAAIAAEPFATLPTAADIVRLLDRAVLAAGRAPRHAVTDKGVQFRHLYLDWCKRNDVRPRFGAVGKHGSIALIERFFRTLKAECCRKILAPLTHKAMSDELAAYVDWYNSERPHQALGGAVPADRLGPPVITQQQFEPRLRYPLPRGDPSGVHEPTVCRVRRLELVVEHAAGRPHLPIVRLRPVA